MVGRYGFGVRTESVCSLVAALLNCGRVPREKDTFKAYDAIPHLYSKKRTNHGFTSFLT